MSQKKLSKEKKEKISEAQEVLYGMPFFTSLQKEAQDIIKELWKNEEVFFNTHGKRWINQKETSLLDVELPIVFIYSTKKVDTDGDIIYDCSDSDYEEDGFYVEIINFENYSPYENVRIQIFGTDNNSLKGMALVGIMDMLRYEYFQILDLHEKIITIYKSNLDIKTQKFCIKDIIEKIDSYIDKNSYKFNFKYSVDVIQSLNDLFKDEEKYDYEEKYEWLQEGDSFIAQLALEAYREITYYDEWLNKHKILEKHFKEKRTNINTQYREIIEYMDIKPPYAFGNLPEHPQDILHGLTSSYWDYYGREEKMKDKGIQEIIKIISDYERMPKKSKELKKMELEQNIKTQIVGRMRHYKATDEEVMNFLFDWDIEEKMFEKIFKDMEEYFKHEIAPQIIGMELNEDTENKIIALIIDKILEGTGE